MSSKQIPNHVLQQKYFYPVQDQQGVFVGSNHLITKDVTPRMIMDQDTLVVYLVDANGNLYMQPAHMFPKEILNAPLWKTKPLPRVDFERMVTPPVTPPTRHTAAPAPQSHVPRQGYVPSLAYTGQESAQWRSHVDTRGSTNGYYYQYQQPQYQSQPQPAVHYVPAQPNVGYVAQPPKKRVHFAS